MASIPELLEQLGHRSDGVGQREVLAERGFVAAQLGEAQLVRGVRDWVTMKASVPAWRSRNG